MHDLVLLGIGLILTIGTGFFVASEFALVNLERSDLEARRDRGERNLSLTIGALKRTSTHLSSAQLGITLTTLLAGYTLEPSISNFLRPSLTGLGMSETVVSITGSVIAVVIATLLSMIVGELVPKNFALALPRQTAKVVIPFQVAFTWLFRPAVVGLNETANSILRRFGIEPKEELSSARTAEELRSLVRRSAHAGSLDQDTATLLSRTLDFARLTADEVMTPRPRVASIERSENAAAVIELTRTTGFSRFPIIGDGMDDVIGFVHVKNAIAVPRERRAEVPVSALKSDALRVPETMKLDVLLGELRGRGLQMAVVVDEYGGTAGVVTLEDLVEELVGEVADEHDRTAAGIVRTLTGLTFPGMLRPDELLERAGVHVPEEGPYETVGGFMMSELGAVPVVGDRVSTDAGVLEVVRMDGRRIDRIRFTPAPAESAVEAGDAS